VIAYIGVPLMDSKDNTLGSMCVIEHEPRQWRSQDVEILHDFAAAVMDRVEGRS
jgi:GAF domain-containing protein